MQCRVGLTSPATRQVLRSGEAADNTTLRQYLSDLCVTLRPIELFHQGARRAICMNCMNERKPSNIRDIGKDRPSTLPAEYHSVLLSLSTKSPIMIVRLVIIIRWQATINLSCIVIRTFTGLARTSVRVLFVVLVIELGRIPMTTLVRSIVVLCPDELDWRRLDLFSNEVPCREFVIIVPKGRVIWSQPAPFHL